MVEKPIPGSAAPLLPRRFVLTLFLIGSAYMVLMTAAASMLKNEQLRDVWWWTGIPVAWLIATLIYWRHFVSEGFRTPAMAAVRRHPGYSILFVGMVPLVMAFGIVNPPSADMPDRDGMSWFEIGGMAVIAAAAAGSWLLRRRRS